MLEDHKKLLYPSAQDGQKKLDTTLELLNPNELPTTTYEAKQVVCPLGLEIQKIHACPNDCIMYRGKDYENLDECPVCKASRYKLRRDDSGNVEGEECPRKKIPAKLCGMLL
jgi:hypothetical protein